MKLRAGLVVAAALVLVGCTSAGVPHEQVSESSAAAPIPEASTEAPTAQAFVWHEMPVSAGCAAAFKAAEDEAITTEGADDTKLVQTGVVCPGVDEWLSALKARPGAFGMTGQATIDAQMVLSALCYPSRNIPVCQDANSRGLSVYAK